MSSAYVRYGAIGVAALAVTTALIAGHPQQAPTSTGPKTAVQQFKNIQILKDIPADQLIPSMQFITYSLGVECSFCHVEGAFDKDDKQEKKIARKMMAMMLTINQENFEGKKMVTCNTCHRGMPHPLAIPVITAEEREPASTEEMEKEHEASHAKMAAPDAVIDAYLKAVGGEAALAKLNSVVEKGTIPNPKGEQKIDIYEETPARRVSIAHMPMGDSVTAFNGQEGWLMFPKRPVHMMTPGEQYGAKLDAEFLVPSDPRKAFAQLKTAKAEQIDGKEVNVVLGINEDQPPVRLYFDKQSGLLVRIVNYAETPLGQNPKQVDLADYREKDGVKLPFQWTIARPFGRFTIKVDSVEVNAKIDADKFEKPAAQPQSPAGPGH